MYSGKFVLRVTPALHKALSESASAQGLSLNQYIADQLAFKKASPSENELLIQQLRQLFSKKLIGVVLFGSTARGDNKSTSDLDLLIVLDDTVAITRDLYRLWSDAIENKVSSPYSPQLTHLPKNLNQVTSLWLEAALEGEIFFERDALLRRTIFKIKNKIAAGEYKRKISYGHHYWVRSEEQNAK